jgi:hypothetical protein
MTTSSGTSKLRRLSVVFALAVALIVATGAAPTWADPSADPSGAASAAPSAAPSESASPTAGPSESPSASPIPAPTPSQSPQTPEPSPQTPPLPPELSTNDEPATLAPINLRSIESFSVFGGTISNTGPSQLTGNAGTSPGTGGIAFPPGKLTGALHLGDDVAAQALIDLKTAYDETAALPGTAEINGDLAGKTFSPGVYHADAAITISTVIFLDAAHDSSSVFVFQIPEAFTVAASARIVLINGAQTDHVFWQVAGAVTLGASSIFQGTILADVALTVGADATVFGRVLSIIGAVTTSTNSIMPQAPVLLASASAFSILAATSVRNEGNSVFSASVGVSPGNEISGFPPGMSLGGLHRKDGEANQAQVDLAAAYEDAANRTPDGRVLPANLNGTTIAAGIHRSVGAVSVTSAVTLDGQNNPDSIFVLQVNGHLSTGGKIRLINMADPNRIFWQIAGGAILGAGSEFAGMLLAAGQIDIGQNVRLVGRALTTGGAVTALDASADTLTSVDLRTVSTYSALAATAIYNTGYTVVNFSVGVSPGDNISGFPPGEITNGTLEAGSVAAAQAQTDAHLAFDDASRRTPTRSIDGDIGGQTFLPGVYFAPAAINNGGIIELDAQGDPNAVFIFQVAAAFTTAAESEIELVNGAQYSRVFWQVEGAVTLGAESTFTGTVISDAAVTAGDQMFLNGRLVSLAGPVTIGGTGVESPVPVPGSLTATTAQTSLSGVIIDGINTQYAEGISNGWSIADDRGTGQSWSLTISSSGLISEAGTVDVLRRTLPPGSLSVVAGAPIAADGSDAITNITSKTITLSSTPQSLISSSGLSRGAYFFSPKFILAVPPLAYRSNYSGTPGNSPLNPYVATVVITIS